MTVPVALGLPLFVQHVLLLSEAPARMSIRAVCVFIVQEGEAAMDVLSLACRGQGQRPPDDLPGRIEFWSPWVGTRVLSMVGSLSPAHFERMRRAIRPYNVVGDDPALVLRYHCSSNVSILYQTYVHGEPHGRWVDSLSVWRSFRA